MEIGRLFDGVYVNRKVLLTGHTGFKGSWLMLWLEQMGAEVCGYSLEPNTKPAHYSLLKLNSRSEIGDIRDINNLKKLTNDFQPEIVFHLAAQPLVRYSYVNPIETYETNVMGTLNVLEACRSCPTVKAIVVITTDKCYDNKEWVWGYRETDPMGGFDPYSSSKGCAELLINSYRNSYFNIEDYGFNHHVLLASARAGNVIGGGDWAEDRLIPDVMRAASEGRTVNIRNPLATRPWQHVLEPLSGYLLLGQRLFEGNKEFAEAWNFGPDNNGTQNVGDLLKMIKPFWSRIDYSIIDGNFPHEAGLLKLDCSKANQILLWKENLDIQHTIQYTADWYKDYFEKGKVTTREQLTKYIQLAKLNSLIWAKEN